MKLLALGDVFGRPGRKILKSELANLIQKHQVDFTIVNGENASGGNGLTTKNAKELLDLPIDAMTMGNHVWQHKEFLQTIEEFPQIVRPLNYPEPCPGKGIKFFAWENIRIALINLSGQIYMPSMNCPFNTISPLMDEIKKKADIILVDFHAEATSEKVAMGYFLDGWASLVFGTHTHVQTADERILEKGTAYITDLGMTGPRDGVIGVDRQIIIETMVTKRPKRFEVAKGPVQINGIILEIDNLNHHVIGIERLYQVYERP